MNNGFIQFFLLPPIVVPAKNCKAIQNNDANAVSGIYEVQSNNARTYKVFCDMDLEEGGWTVILRRTDGTIDFNRDWSEYKTGFGNLLNGNYFLGLENINALTDPTLGKFELWVGLEKHPLPNLPQFRHIVTSSFAHYKNFRVGDAQSLYQLTVSEYQESSTAGDSLKSHNTAPFSTPDHDNDKDKSKSCAQEFKSGWWFTNCLESNLAGVWRGKGEGERDQGIIWESFSGDKNSLKSVVMAVRPLQ